MTKIILDCDPGHDDAVAIMLAHASPMIDLLGISVVTGNQTLANTQRNALNVCQWIGCNAPVYAGCERPLVREKMIAGDIHGSTGLDGPVFPETTKKLEEKHSVQFIIDTLTASEEPVTLVTTGPMTNVALALRLKPAITEKIERIVLMGGSYTNGNVTPAAEFNILADPEAAHICFTCGRPVYMVGLDVTRKVLCYPEIVARMGAIGNRASALFVAMMGHFCATQKAVFGWEGGPLHDPVTIASLIDPDVVTFRKMHAEVDHTPGPSYGRTNCDAFDYMKKEKNVYVAVDINAARFWDIVEEALRSIPDPE